MASSTLVQQLQAVQQLQKPGVGSGPGVRRPKGKPSLLFDPQQAADIDVEAIHELGLQGLTELCRLNPRFAALRQPLFSRAAASIVREQQQPDVVAKLDAAIHDFCALLTEHFLASAAFKALEYLIRRFKANEYNIPSLIMAGLPYHGTNEFVRLLQTMPLDSRRGLWAWLAPSQASGASIPRDTIVRCVATEPSLRDWLCSTARALGTGPSHSPVFLSFYAVTMVEVVAAFKVVGEAQVSGLLAAVGSGLEAGASPDYRAATHMLVASLSSRTTFSPVAVKGIVNSLVRGAPLQKEAMRNMLLVLGHLAATQPALDSVGEKALQALVALPGLVGDLGALQEEGVNLAPLLRLLSTTLSRRVAKAPAMYAPHLLALIRSGLLAEVAENLARALLLVASDTPAPPSDVVAACGELLRALDMHYAEQTDAAVNAVLASASRSAKPSGATNKGDGDEGASSEEEAEGGEHGGSARQRARVFEVVQAVFTYSAHAPLEVAGAGGAVQALTLTAAITAPAARVRRMALQRMGELVAGGELPAEAHAHLTSCILRRLQDGDMGVVGAALGLPCLPSLPPAALLPHLAPAALRASSIVFSVGSGAAPDVKHARAALRKAVGLLARLAAAQGQKGGDDNEARVGSEATLRELQDAALLVALQVALPARHALKASRAGLEALHRLTSPLTWNAAELAPLAAGLLLKGDEEGADGDAGDDDTQHNSKKKKTKKVKEQEKKETEGTDVSDAGAVSRAAAAAAQAKAAAEAAAGVVTALARAMTTGPQAASAAAEAVRLAGVARQLEASEAPALGQQPGLLRARHVLLLALAAAVKHSPAGPQAPTAEQKVACAGHLLSLCLQELSGSRDTATLPAATASGWQDAVARCLDAHGLPTPAHGAEAAAEGAQRVHFAALCDALLTALDAAPAAPAPPSGGATASRAVVEVFSQVARLAPEGSFDAHLKLVVQKALPDPQSQAAFLASQYCPVESGAGAEGEAGRESVQTAALRLAAALGGAVGRGGVHITTPIKGGHRQRAPAATTGDIVAAVTGHVPHLLAAACSPASSPSVRRAAVDALAEIGRALAALPAASHAGPVAVGHVLSALAPHAAWAASDANAIPALISKTLSGLLLEGQPSQQAEAPPSTPSTPAVKARGSKRAAVKGGSSEQGAGEAGSPAAGPRRVAVSAAVLCDAVAHLAAGLPRLVSAPHDVAAALALTSHLIAPILTLSAGASGDSNGHPDPVHRTVPVLTAAGLQALQALLMTAPPGQHPPAPLSQLQQALGAALIACVFAPSRPVGAMPAAVTADATAVFLQALSPAAQGAAAGPQAQQAGDWFASTAPLREAAQRLVGHAAPPRLLDTASLATQTAIVHRLAASAASDTSLECRAAARAALERLPISADHVAPVLIAAAAAPHAPAAPVAIPDETPSKRRKGTRQAARTEPAPQPAAATQPAIELRPLGALEQAVLLLEVLQWKPVSVGQARLVTASQSLLAALQPRMGSVVQSHALGRDEEAAGDDGEGDTARMDVDKPAAVAELVPADDPTVRSSLAGYAAQLSLSLLEACAVRAGTDAGAGDAGRDGDGGDAASTVLAAFDLRLALDAARHAPDAAVRNGALALLARLAELAPSRALDLTLEVLSLLKAPGAASAVDDDARSAEVMATTISAVTRAWISHGNDLAEIWASVVAALPELPPHRRLPLLTTLLTAAGDSSEALPAGLMALVTAAVTEQQRAAGADQAEATTTSAAGAEWLLDLAALLAATVPLAARVKALAGLLTRAAGPSGGQAHSPLARLTAAFITAQLKARAVLAMGPEAQLDEALLPSCEALMAQVMASVQVLTAAADSGAPTGPAATGSAPGRPGRGKKQAGAAAEAHQVAAPLAPHLSTRAVRTSLKALYDVFEALQAVMAPHSYLAALLRLAGHGDGKASRSALRLFADRAAGLPTDLEVLQRHPAYDAAGRAAAVQRLAAAALGILPRVRALRTRDGGSAPGLSALATQLTLTALSHVASAFGATHGQEISGVVPVVLQHTSQPRSSAVRGAALLALAAIVRACGPQLLPQLPAIAQGVLGACQASTAAVARVATSPAGATGAAPGGDKKRPGSGADDDGSAEGADADSALATLQVAAVELAAGLAALSALVSALGPFLSPYLPALLRGVLHPAVLGCSAAGCSAAAAAIRTSLATAMPSRLLLQPLFDTLPYAKEQGLPAFSALLETVGEVTARTGAAVAAAHADAVTGFVLAALDVRGPDAPAGLAGQEAAAEAAAVAALVALTLKLSEVQFKPLFGRLLEWAGVGPGAVGLTVSTPAPLGRRITLFAAAAGLAEALRSVFVPYFRFLLEPAVQCLGAGDGGAAAGATAAGKKRKKAHATTPVVAAPPAAAGDPVQTWLLRAKALRALHRCFLYDSVGFIDGDKVRRLLPGLVDALGQRPAAAAAAVIAREAADAVLDAALTLGPRSPTDTYGVAAAGALLQLALTANSDVQWKAINHDVLMTTRAGDARTRCLALEVVYHMAARLREEYLTLLPETLPFLAELLEEPDAGVEARARDVLRLLEEVSGEKMDAYLKPG